MLLTKKRRWPARNWSSAPAPSIEKNLGDYYIFEIDKNPVACVALHVYPEQSKGELACLYVNPSHENQGIGRKLIQFVENKAREAGLERAHHALDPGVHLFSIQRRICRRHARRLAARPPREIRRERAQLEGAGEEVESLITGGGGFDGSHESPSTISDRVSTPGRAADARRPGRDCSPAKDFSL